MEQSLNQWLYGFAVAGAACLVARPRLFDPRWRGRIWGSALAGLALLSLLPLLGALDVAWHTGGPAGPGMPGEGPSVSHAGEPGLVTLPALPVPVTVMLAVWGSVALARIGLLASAVARIRAARAASRTFPAGRLARLPEWTAANAGRFALVLSDRVAVPSMLGFGRPMVAVPAAWLRRLSDEALDAVLLHELSHAERRDDLFALGQQLLLALCWFHPAAWWVVRRLAFEREAACDQRAARLTTTRRYARCLVAIAEAMQEGPLPARALVASSAGSRRHIERRLKQLVAGDARVGIARSAQMGLPAAVAVMALVIAVPGFPRIFDVGSDEASNLEPPPVPVSAYAGPVVGPPLQLVSGPRLSADRSVAASRTPRVVPARPDAVVPGQLALVQTPGGSSVADASASAVQALPEPPLSARGWSEQLAPLAAAGEAGLQGSGVIRTPAGKATVDRAAGRPSRVLITPDPDLPSASFKALGSAFARAGAGTGRWFFRAGASVGSAFTPR